MKKFISLVCSIVLLAISISGAYAQEMRFAPATDICGIAAFDNGVSCIVSYNDGIYRTTNKGSNWTLTYTDTDTSLNLISIASQGNVGVAVGTKSINNIHRSVFIKTADGGLTWQRLTVPHEFDAYPYAVAIRDKKILVVHNQKSWISEDEGESWSYYSSSSLSVSLNGHLQIASNGLMIYSAMETHLSTDGVNWYELSQPWSEDIRAVCLVNNKLIGVGMGDNMRGVILTDWLKQDVAPIRLPYRSMLHDVKFIDDNTGYACGARISDSFSWSAPIVYKTTNHGISWFSIYEGAQQNNDGTLYNIAVNGDAVVCQGVDFVVPIENSDLDNPIGQGSGQTQKPQQYSISQNYPNPFNPTTTIGYRMEKGAFLTIKVYDGAGKEIAVLVNEFKAAGHYSVDFNAGNLPSGVYYYAFSAAGYTVTKKMMLVK